jgi:hypothetical protein
MPPKVQNKSQNERKRRANQRRCAGITISRPRSVSSTEERMSAMATLAIFEVGKKRANGLLFSRETQRGCE